MDSVSDKTAAGVVRIMAWLSVRNHILRESDVLAQFLPPKSGSTSKSRGAFPKGPLLETELRVQKRKQ